MNTTQKYLASKARVDLFVRKGKNEVIIGRAEGAPVLLFCWGRVPEGCLFRSRVERAFFEILNAQRSAGHS